MFNPSNDKVSIAEQNPKLRVNNFNEVVEGYTASQAQEEAQRCLNCQHQPCVRGCPVNVPIPQFIAAVACGDFEAAYQIIKTENYLPAICGRVCPQETQCEQYCIRNKAGNAVAIGRLERFVADYHLTNVKEMNEVITDGSKKVAVVGSGPAGLTCASELASQGYLVTIFEALHAPGGVLTYGIPEFRLPKYIVNQEIERLVTNGIKIEKNVVVGYSITIEEILTDLGYAAVFVATGAGTPRFMGIEGEYLNGVYSANEFLTRVNLMKANSFPYAPTPVKVGSRVAVIGGGNVAIDAARTAKRLGAEEVYIVYRRSMSELPARKEEVQHALEEGIIFNILQLPVQINGENGSVASLECVRMKLGQPDDSGRRRPMPIIDSNICLDIDTVIVAIGQTPNTILSKLMKNLQTTEWGGIVVDEQTMATNIEKVYAGGDAVTGAASVIMAMGAGKRAAKAIDKFIKMQ